MDWNTLYCPNPWCACYGIPFPQSGLVKNGSSRGQKQALCRVCGGSVALKYGTAYFGLDANSSIFETAFRALAEGNSIRGTARIVEIDPETCRDWLDRYGQHCRLVMLYLWHELHLEECQLDELWSFAHTKEANLAAARADLSNVWRYLGLDCLCPFVADGRGFCGRETHSGECRFALAAGVAGERWINPLLH